MVVMVILYLQFWILKSALESWSGLIQALGLIHVELRPHDFGKPALWETSAWQCVRPVVLTIGIVSSSINRGHRDQRWRTSTCYDAFGAGWTRAGAGDNFYCGVGIASAAAGAVNLIRLVGRGQIGDGAGWEQVCGGERSIGSCAHTSRRFWCFRYKVTFRKSTWPFDPFEARLETVPFQIVSILLLNTTCNYFLVFGILFWFLVIHPEGYQ